MSIRTRLTLWYTGLLALFLLIFDVLIYVSLQGILLGAMDERIASQAQSIVALVQAENNPVNVILSGRVKLPPIDAFASQYYVQIVQLDGHVVQSSANLWGRTLPLPPEQPSDQSTLKNSALKDSAGDSALFTVQVEPGVRLRIYSQPITLADRAIGSIQVAQSLTVADDSLAASRRVLLGGSLSLLLLSAFGGAFLARAALRPINAITEIARHITSSQDLEQRIPVTVPSDELGQLVETINDMLARLESLFAVQQRLVADVSHELRTPLTTIQGNLDLLRRGAVNDPGMRAEALAAIGDEAARMRRLLNDLLLLAQADAGLKLHRVPVEMDTLLLEVYRQAQVMAGGIGRETGRHGPRFGSAGTGGDTAGGPGGITVRLGAEDQALVWGDADRLRQMLLNLVDNALKYTQDGGEVTLTLRRNGGWVRVGVEDTGVGIAPDDLPHLFERFYRADRSRTRAPAASPRPVRHGRDGLKGSAPEGGNETSGAGLGLAIVQWIAQAHDGRVEVESALGKGSTFTVWLPELKLAEAGNLS